MERYVNTETLKRNIRVNFMPNVDVDGTVTVENAERYFLNLIDKTSTADVAEVVRCKDCTYRYTKACGSKHERADMDFCSHGLRKSGEK